MKFIFISFFYAVLSLTKIASAQTLPVGLFEPVEDLYRRQQLLGSDSSGGSYMIRPIVLPSNHANITSSLNKTVYSNQKFKTEVSILPFVLQQQINTHHPYGINDGSMVQTKGYQMQFSGGLYARVGPLSIQLRPEYVFADNKDFIQLSDGPDGIYYNTIDLPDRFGDKNYSKVGWGQSSIRLNAGPVSAGISNENLWWGPGNRNSLLMSNNAAGFAHFTLNTTRPVKTFIGSFEAQIIGGRLEQSGIPAPNSYTGPPRPDDSRYISGMVITYQPKWIPGFYVGLDRTFVVNNSTMGNTFADYFPIFKAVSKSAYQNADGSNKEDAAARDQYISFFTRYVLPESRAEIYFQYGRNDHSYDIRDGVVEPEHSRAYLVGFRKLVALRAADEFIQIGVELTQLEEAKTRPLRGTASWYTHYQVLDGYTNRGQVLGAGIGPGSNLQSLDVSWVKGLKRVGLQFERLVNFNDILYDLANKYPENEYFDKHWVDLSIAGKFAWDFNKLTLNSQLTYIRSLNYQYQWQQSATNPSDWGKHDANNLQFKVGLMYHF
jgi:hypothetical protein